MNKLLSFLIYALTGAIGVAAFLYPFLLPVAEAGATQNRQTPLLTAILLLVCLVVVLLELQGPALGAKRIATLGVLVAITSILRFVEVAIPLPGGFSPVFAPIIVVGYVFGARFGFLMGTMTLFVSALVTGGVGPWLPYQMIVAGWIGASAGLLPVRLLGTGRRALVALVVFGVVWGVLYGVLINLYTWPYFVGEAAFSRQPGASVGDSIGRYAAYYIVTSLLWDMVRAVGNALLIAILGAATLKALRRFRDRIQFHIVPPPAPVEGRP